MQAIKHRCARALVSSAAVMVAVLLASTRAEAIPAYARKYKTSCQTCHIAYPKLNPFGEAFRLRGYRMPAETEDQIKETPVSLGAPGYKRLWPDAVWPSDMPGTLPLSLDTTFTNLSSHRSGGDHGDETIKNDFRFPEEVGVLWGGTLGETLSFFGEVAFKQEAGEGHSGLELEMEHGQLNFNGLFGSGTAFNLKIGRFAPEITQPISHSHLLTTGGPAPLLQFVPIAAHGGSQVGGHDATGIALPHSVDGLEVYGILRHRVLYSAGLANGLGPGDESMDGNDAKDVFGRVAFKIGGLPLDGEGFTPSDKNWQERSLTLGVFAYRGDGSGVLARGQGHHADELIEDRTFTRVGFDVSVFFQDLNLLAGMVRGRDTLAEYEEMAGHGDEVEVEFTGEDDFTYRTWFVEADYVAKPWLHGALRYEWLDPANQRQPSFKRIVPNVTALIRANVKAYFEYQRNLGENDDYVVIGGLRFAF
ncbi:MAG: hypothetical protein WD227_10270 [Vicinamibacterales bacterium]